MVSLRRSIKTSERLETGRGNAADRSGVDGIADDVGLTRRGRTMPLTETRGMPGAAASRSWVAFLIRHCLGGMVVGAREQGGIVERLEQVPAAGFRLAARYSIGDGSVQKPGANPLPSPRLGV